MCCFCLSSAIVIHSWLYSGASSWRSFQVTTRRPLIRGTTYIAFNLRLHGWLSGRKMQGPLYYWWKHRPCIIKTIIKEAVMQILVRKHLQILLHRLWKFNNNNILNLYSAKSKMRSCREALNMENNIKISQKNEEISFKWLSKSV